MGSFIRTAFLPGHLALTDGAYSAAALGQVLCRGMPVAKHRLTLQSTTRFLSASVSCVLFVCRANILAVIQWGNLHSETLPRVLAQES